MQTGGYFSKREFRPQETYRIFNTWMGDPSKMIQLEAFLETYESDHLMENANITGEYLLNGLEMMQEKFPQLLSKARGTGTFCAIDFPTSDIRDKMVGVLRQCGVQSGGCGEVTLRCRPTLIFKPRHAAEFLNIFEHSLKFILK